jgi:hypothetical protein
MPLEPARTTRQIGAILSAAVVVTAVLVTLHPASVTSLSRAAATPLAEAPVSEGDGHLPRQGRGGLGISDGVVPDGTTVFARVPAVTRLQPAFLAALRRAATAAAGDHVEIVVNSGWRSAAYQEELLDRAVATYGSRDAAARWVATPRTSAHVSGEAADLGPGAATRWLAEHGAAYGLCPVYRNEPWHYELRPKAVDQGCPDLYADPTHDPRMAR